MGYKRGRKDKMEMSLKDRLTIFTMWFLGMIVLILIAVDPLEILDATQEIILAVIVLVVNVPLVLYKRQRILKKMKE